MPCRTPPGCRAVATSAANQGTCRGRLRRRQLPLRRRGDGVDALDEVLLAVVDDFEATGRTGYRCLALIGNGTDDANAQRAPTGRTRAQHRQLPRERARCRQAEA
jgi:hypothetical protein